MKLIVSASIIFYLTLLNPGDCEAYRILGVFPVDLKSHFIMFEALMKELARKGHQVDVASPFPQTTTHPNYTDIVLPAPTDRLANNLSYQYFKTYLSPTFTPVKLIAEKGGNEVCENLGHPDIMKIIRNPPTDPPYDLLITEVFGAHCFMALGHHLKVPTIGICSTILYSWANRIIVNPHNIAIAPNNFLNYVAPWNFWQRLHNTVHTVFNDLYFQYLTKPQSEAIKKYIGENAPDIRKAESSVALVLANSHPSVNGPRPVTTALIEVGGLHIRDDGPELPKDLIRWMDESTNGFIYFTFGSMVTIESFPEQIVRAFYKSLGKLAPIRILIKIPNPHKLPPGLPNNFRTFAWATQFKVLKHKNVKAFITHGGLLGTQEAIYCGVPLIGIPLFADQYVNIDLYTKKKMAVSLSYESLTEEKIDAAVREILYNPIYKNTMLKVSTMFRDRPMSAMDTATWWVEYVIRHGSDAVRSPAMDLPGWQIALLDVYATLFLTAAAAVFSIFVLIRFIIKRSVALLARTVTLGKKIK